MGLISRVSSRTYRKEIFKFLKKLSQKNQKKWLNKTLPSPPNPEGPERPTSTPLLISEGRSCPLLFLKNSGASTTSGLCQFAKTMRLRSLGVNLKVNRLVRLLLFTGVNISFRLRGSRGRKLGDNP